MADVSSQCYLAARGMVFTDKTYHLKPRPVVFCEQAIWKVRPVVYCEPGEIYKCWLIIRDGDIAAPVERSRTKIMFMYDNLWDAGALTSSSAVEEFPDTNTQHRWHHKCWRSDGEGEQWLKRDLGSAQNIRAFILKQHWFLPSATVKIQANSSDSWDSPPLDVSLEICEPLIPLVKFWDANQSYRWWRVSMNANDDEMMFRGDKDSVHYCHHSQRAGRIYLGNFWSPSVNFAYDNVLGLIDEVRKYRTLDGQIASYKVTHYKKVRYEFEFLNQDDADTFEEMFDIVGRTVPLFICENDQYWWKLLYYSTFIQDFEIQRMSGAKGTYYKLSINVETMR